jgi:hypothetical protein
MAVAITRTDWDAFEHARGKPIQLWWQDEARVGRQSTLTRLWPSAAAARPHRINQPICSAPSARRATGGGLRSAARQRLGDEFASERNQPPRRRGRTCRRHLGRSSLAS